MQQGGTLGEEARVQNQAFVPGLDETRDEGYVTDWVAQGGDDFRGEQGTEVAEIAAGHAVTLEGQRVGRSASGNWSEWCQQK